jgi:hypothetical protein
MKIIATLIHEGISYGIPEGTKVPEKPKYIDTAEYVEERLNEKTMKQYKEALQALLSVSIQWEDQEVAKELICYEKHIRDVANFKPEEGGIYPLEGVEAEKVWQWKSRYAPHWFDVKEGTEAGKSVTDQRVVLRLIPQPNSEQKMKPEYKCHVAAIVELFRYFNPFTALIDRQPRPAWMLSIFLRLPFQ